MSAERPHDHQDLLKQVYGLAHTPAPEQRPKRLEPRRYRPIAKPAPKQPMPDTEPPRLRLVGTEVEVRGAPFEVRSGAQKSPTPSAPAKRTQPIKNPTDPRWLMAVRVSEQLQGTILPPEARERLMKLGRVLGLSAFDSSLVIAIVQDQARRGHRPEHCPTAGEAQLQMVPLPRTASFKSAVKNLGAWQMAMILAAIIVTELLVLTMFFG